MSSVRSTLRWKHGWSMRIIAFSFIVLFVGIGSQVLVHTLTANAKMLSVNVTTYHEEGRMADGHWAYNGACAVSPAQFPFGTVIALYNQDGSFIRQCVAEDTTPTLKSGHIALVVPDGTTDLNKWTNRQLSFQILHWGSNQQFTNQNFELVSHDVHLSNIRTPFEAFHDRYYTLVIRCTKGHGTSTRSC